MKWTPDEMQFMIDALDTHVRTKGLSVAAMAALIAQRIKEEYTQQAEKPPVKAE